MIKEIKKITKQNLDLKNLEENQLSNQLSLDGFSFCIYNSNYKIINAFAHFEFENVNTPYKHLELVENLFKQEPLLQAKFKNVNVTHFNNLVTQVPLPFFNKDNLGDYLKYSVKVLENDYLVYDQISNSEIVNVYIPFVNINNFLIDKFGAFNYKHSSTVLIETLLNKYKNFEKEIMFVNVTNLNFEIVVLKKNKLELYNSFSFKTKEDFIYYILFVAEQLNLNPEEFQLLLLGDIEKESELYAIAFQYVRNIDFYKEHSTIKIIENVSPHSYFTLLNQF